MNIKNSLTYRYFRQGLSLIKKVNPAGEIFQICLCVTSKCNARCIMCDVWKKPGQNDFTLSELEKFLSKSSLPNIAQFSLSGGEPFLRKDIVEIAKVIHKYHSNVEYFIATNCIATDTIVAKAKRIADITKTTLCISMDGIEESTHDTIRGEGVYKKMIKTIGKVSKIPQLNLSWSFTIQPLNYNQILDVYKYSKPFTSRNPGKTAIFCARPASAGAYFKNIGKALILNEQQKREAISQLEKISKNMGNGGWINYVISFMKTGKKPIPCGAGKYSCIITADFEVYPCSHCPESWSYGNLREHDYSLQSLMDTPKARDIARKVSTCQKCANEIEGYSTASSAVFLRFSLLKCLIMDLRTLFRKMLSRLNRRNKGGIL